MYKSMKSLLRAVICLLFLVTSYPGLRAADSAPGKPALLFSGCLLFTPNHLFARWLDEKGFALQSQSSLEDKPLTWDVARHYNVIVLSGLGKANADESLNVYDQETIATLHRFLDAGGGILYFPFWMEEKGQVPPQDAFLKPLGLTPSFDEVIFDSTNAVPGTLYNIPFAHTTNIAKSPITEGITSLWYPSATRVGMESADTPFIADSSWNVVAQTMPTAHSSNNPLDRSGLQPESNPGKFKGSIPLVAYRQVGKGRIVYCGVDAVWIYGKIAPIALQGIVGEKGRNGIPSQWNQLVLNSLNWLAETSHGNAQLGGATTDKSLFISPYVTQFVAPQDVSKLPPTVEPGAAIRSCPGVIGARTELSGGHGTVEDWVNEAKGMGLSYLVFLEDFANMTPDNFTKLKSECDRLTDANFAAVPGFRIQDEVGNHYYYFGANIPYPPSKYLTPDGKAWTAYDSDFSHSNRSVKGQLAMTTLNYTYGDGGFKLTSGNYLYDAGTAPFADFFSDYDSMGVITRQNGKIIEDAFPDYLKMVQSGTEPRPLVIDLMDDPTELKQTPWRTVLRINPKPEMVDGGMLDGVNPILTFWSLWHAYPDIPTRIYITDGPVIDYWSLDGTRDYEGANKGDFVWQNLRFRVGGKVHSDAGLKEVDIYDGSKLFRHFLPHGEKQFEFTLNLNHDKQHTLVLLATDMNGNRAIGGDQWDRNHRMEENYIGDRNNQGVYSYQTRKDGTYTLVGGNGATPYKRMPPMVITPAGLFSGDPILGTAGFDGGIGGEAEIYTPITLSGQDGKTISPPQVGPATRLLITADTHIGNSVCDWDFTDGIIEADVWSSLWKAEPAKDFNMELRNQLFSIDPDNPIATWLFKARITLKHDLPNQGLRVAYIVNGNSPHWVVYDSHGKLMSGSTKALANGEAKKETAPFNLGSYAGLLDSTMGSTALFSLTDGLEVDWQQPGPNPININLLADKTTQKQGETTEVSLLLLGIPRLTAHSTAVSTDTMATLARFGRDFGLTTPKPSYSVALGAGQIVDQRYILHVDGSKENAFSGKITGNLIAKLPIEVSGLNDNWSAMLFDRELGKTRPIGLYANEAWATVPMAGNGDFFVGHPVTCDDAKIVLQLAQTGEKSWKLEVHNPTDEDAKVTLQANPFFDPLKGKKLPSGPLEIKAGTSQYFDL